MAKTVGLIFKDDKKVAFKNGKTVEIVENHVENTANALVELTVAQLKEKATALGLEFANNIKKDDLISLIENAEKAAETPEENPELDPDGDK